MCQAFEKSNQPRAPMHDATHFPERTPVYFDVLQIVREGKPQGIGPMRRMEGDRLLQPSIAFANSPGAFRSRKGKDEPFDCNALEAMLSQPYVVVVAYNVYVDHGNGPDSPWDLGTDATMPNAGFPTLYAAQDWARKLHPPLPQ